jgi:hypothetical protein
LVTWAAAGLTNTAITAATPHIVSLSMCLSFSSRPPTAAATHAAAAIRALLADRTEHIACPRATVTARQAIAQRFDAFDRDGLPAAP